MNSNVLTCLRAAGVRSRPAHSAARRRNRLRWLLFSPIRILQPLITFPLSSLQGKRFYVPGEPRPNSKTAAVVDELKEAGVPQHLIVHGHSRDGTFLVKAVRFCLRLPWALGFLLQISRRCQSLDGIDRQTLVNYALARRWLQNRRGLMPIIISDVSPSLHALWAACAAEGNRAIWWQDDFHFHTALPYPIKAAAVLNEPGLATVRKSGTAQIIARRPIKPPLPIRPIPNEPVVGVATQANFEVNEYQVSLLKRLAALLDVSILHLRLHPRRQSQRFDFRDAPVQLASPDETMEQFASRIDLAVVGNSGAQLWLIRNGVPVIHVAGLDHREYDRYGYVERGFVYGLKTFTNDLVEGVRRFYGNTSDVDAKLRSYTIVSLSEDVFELSRMSSLPS